MPCCWPRRAFGTRSCSRTGNDSSATWYRPRTGPLPSADELIDACRERLPDYLVPAVVVPIDAVPLTPNGKLDRGRLPDPSIGSMGGRRPRTPVEERVAALWTELLGVEVGIDDRFFQVGGHSILVIRLVARIQTEFDVALPVTAVFENPTIAGLAAAIETAVLADIEAMSEDEVRGQVLQAQDATA